MVAPEHLMMQWSKSTQPCAFDIWTQAFQFVTAGKRERHFPALAQTSHIFLSHISLGRMLCCLTGSRHSDCLLICTQKEEVRNKSFRKISRPQRNKELWVQKIWKWLQESQVWNSPGSHLQTLIYISFYWNKQHFNMSFFKAV